MRKVALLDTSICTRNMGDFIIMEAVRAELAAIMPNAFFMTLPTHDYLGSESTKILDMADLTFVGGTNLLSSNMNRYNQWKIRFRDRRRITDAVLMGVGWWQYQPNPNLYTRLLLRGVLSNDRLHSLRDGYARKRLAYCGIANSLNTGCPTMWRLTPEHCGLIPAEKGDSVIMTITDYYKAEAHDRKLIEILKSNYGKVYLWVQGDRDWEYAKSIGGADLEFVDPTLAAFDDALAMNGTLDYVGTRLHAGIRAMRAGRRTLILAVDNRAEEMRKDFNLPVISRKDVDTVDELVNAHRPTELTLPWENIQRWKAQFTETDRP